MPLTRPARSQTTPGAASTTLLKLTWTDMTANDDRRRGIAPYRRFDGDGGRRDTECFGVKRVSDVPGIMR